MGIGRDDEQQPTKKSGSSKKEAARPSTPHGPGRDRVLPRNEVAPGEQPQAGSSQAHPKPDYDLGKGIHGAGTVGGAVGSGGHEIETPAPRPEAPAPGAREEPKSLFQRFREYCQDKVLSCATAAFGLVRFPRTLEDSPFPSTSSPAAHAGRYSEESELSTHTSHKSGTIKYPSTDDQTSTDTEAEIFKGNRRPTSSTDRPLTVWTPPPESPIEVHKGGSAPQLGDARKREEAELREDNAPKRTKSARGRMQSKPRDPSDPSVQGRRFSKRIRNIPADDPDQTGGVSTPAPYRLSLTYPISNDIFDIEAIKHVRIKVQQPTPEGVTACIIYNKPESDSSDGTGPKPLRKVREVSPGRVSDNASDTSGDESSDDESDPESSASENEDNVESETETYVPAASSGGNDSDSSSSSDESDSDSSSDESDTEDEAEKSPRKAES